MRARIAGLGFTLVELIVVIVILSILAGVALPRLYDFRSRARDTADDGAIGGIRTALNNKHLNNHLNDAPSNQWILAITDIAGVMDSGELPAGMTIVSVGGVMKLRDLGGTFYSFTAETAISPATLTPD